MKRLLPILLVLCSATPAMTEEPATEEPLLCTLAQIRICTPDAECRVRTADELGVPRFIIVDTKQQKFLAVDENRESKIGKVEKEEGLIFLQGMENKRAWSAVISENSDLTLSASSDGTAFAVFGQCVSLDAVRK